jgi:monovalent cation/proton antiporter MnhG/PhaG subunit
MVEPVVGGIGAALLLLGLTLATIGLYGLLRKPDIFEQLHAAGLVTGSGVILVLLASVGSGRAEIVTSALLVVAFVLVTSSLSTHAIALAAWRQRALRAEARASAGRPGEAAQAAGSPAAMRALVAYDGSPAAGTAVELAASLPWPRGSVILLVGVVGADLPAHAAAEAGPAPVESGAGRFGPALESAAAALARPGLVVERVVRRGHPATAIVDEAAAFGAQLVVIGSRGLGPIRSLLEGSVAMEVVDHAPCPVLVARRATIRSVLLATDGSVASQTATDVLSGWPIFAERRVHVLSVAGETPDDAEAAADEAAGRLRAAGRQPISHVLSGSPVARIVGLADDEDIDVVVLGSRGRTGLTRTLLGSVARDVLSSTPRSVLVVRAVGPAAMRE